MSIPSTILHKNGEEKHNKICRTDRDPISYYGHIHTIRRYELSFEKEKKNMKIANRFGSWASCANVCMHGLVCAMHDNEHILVGIEKSFSGIFLYGADDSFRDKFT